VIEGHKAEIGEVLAQWDPYSLPIISEYEGTVKLQDVIDGITMHEEKNRITGLIERVIIEHRAEQLQPQVLINESGQTESRVSSSRGHEHGGSRRGQSGSGRRLG
jgi:DNA-directed RNA polymerase subunit beta'